MAKFLPVSGCQILRIFWSVERISGDEESGERWYLMSMMGTRYMWSFTIIGREDLRS